MTRKVSSRFLKGWNKLTPENQERLVLHAEQFADAPRITVRRTFRKRRPRQIPKEEREWYFFWRYIADDGHVVEFYSRHEPAEDVVIARDLAAIKRAIQVHKSVD